MSGKRVTRKNTWIAEILLAVMLCGFLLGTPEIPAFQKPVPLEGSARFEKAISDMAAAENVEKLSEESFPMFTKKMEKNNSLL